MPEPEAETYAAPAHARPGTPSPEALQRLQAAVSKVPAQPTEAPRPAASADGKGRFGINSLINRMTGHGPGEADRSAFNPGRQQPPVQSARPAVNYDAEEDADHERIEIPAFLRRQAN
jgi:cell division protein FtsZ